MNTLIEESSNPFERLYFRVSHEVMKVYSDPNSKYTSSYLTKLFGDTLEITDINRPLPITKVSKLMGMGEAYITDLLKRYQRDSNVKPYINLKTFAQKIEPHLGRALGKDTASKIISEYLKGEGKRLYLFYSLYKVLSDTTNKFYSLGQFSEIFFKRANKVSILLRSLFEQKNIFSIK